VGDNRGKLIENQPPPNAAPTPVAPSPRLTAELDRVAASARDLIDEITKKTNFEIDDEFPKQRLLDIAADDHHPGRRVRDGLTGWGRKA
jgi:hypothetical protein